MGASLRVHQGEVTVAKFIYFMLSSLDEIRRRRKWKLRPGRTLTSQMEYGLT